MYHIVPKIDELRISIAHDNCPDIFGLCETFLTDSFSDDQMLLTAMISYVKTDQAHRKSRRRCSTILSKNYIL